VELSQWDEFSRRFEPVAGSEHVQMMWCDADWSIVRAEYDPAGNKGRGVFYGATHDVFSWMPTRVDWRHPRTLELVGTLATYSVQLCWPARPSGECLPFCNPPMWRRATRFAALSFASSGENRT
jgi:hypothetical protein